MGHYEGIGSSSANVDPEPSSPGPTPLQRQTRDVPHCLDVGRRLPTAERLRATETTASRGSRSAEQVQIAMQQEQKWVFGGDIGTEASAQPLNHYVRDAEFAERRSAVSPPNQGHERPSPPD